MVITKLLDNSGTVEVLPMRSDGSSNAHVIDASGDLRCKIEIPESFRGGIGFCYAYYVNKELTLIYATHKRDFAFVVDEKTGKIIRSYETR